MAISQWLPLQIAPGTQPSLDNTALASLYWTATDKAYFKSKDGTLPRLTKIPGWESTGQAPDDGFVIGAARSIFSYFYQQPRTIIGTSHRLIALQGGQFYNITPLQDTSVAIANSLDTNYTTLANNPISVSNGSRNVTISHTAHKLYKGDRITLSGVPGAIGGIAAATLNATHIVTSAGSANSYRIRVATAATSSATGGGAAVIEKTRIITVHATAHGMYKNSRVKISGATTFGGIPAGDINKEHIIRNIDTFDVFDIVVDTEATSSVTSGGGASTEYYPPIDAGAIDVSAGMGYGMGKYGVGLYGVSKASTQTYTLPRIWSFGRFGNDLICCPGDGGNIYIWDGNVDEAPTRLSNSPDENDWIYVANNAVVSLRGNRIQASDIGDATEWTPGPDTQAYDDTVEGLGDFISQARAGTVNLHFTTTQVATFIKVNNEDIWLSDYAWRDDGLIGPKARIELEDYVFWMGQHDLYFFDGSNVQKCPNNTCHEYIFRSLNRSQAYKTFLRPDPENDQFIVYFPTGSSTEPNEYCRVNYKRWDYTLGTKDRTAAEEPNSINAEFSYMATGASETVDAIIYKHGPAWKDADGAVMHMYGETNYKWLRDGKKTLEVQNIIPDSIQTGSVTLTGYGKNFPQGAVKVTEERTITPTTEFVGMPIAARLRKYRIESNEIGGDFSMGLWSEDVQEGGNQ